MHADDLLLDMTYHYSVRQKLRRCLCTSQGCHLALRKAK